MANTENLYPEYLLEVRYEYNTQRTSTISTIKKVRDYVFSQTGQEITPETTYFINAGLIQGGENDGKPYIEFDRYPNFIAKDCDALLWDTMKSKLRKVKIASIKFYFATYKPDLQELLPPIEVPAVKPPTPPTPTEPTK